MTPTPEFPRPTLHHALLRLNSGGPDHIALPVRESSSPALREVAVTTAPPGLVEGDVLEVRPTPSGQVQVARLVSPVPGVSTHFRFHDGLSGEDRFEALAELHNFDIDITELSPGKYFSHFPFVHGVGEPREILDVILGTLVTVSQARTRQQRAEGLRGAINPQLLPHPAAGRTLPRNPGKHHRRSRCSAPPRPAA